MLFFAQNSSVFGVSGSFFFLLVGKGGREKGREEMEVCLLMTK